MADILVWRSQHQKHADASEQKCFCVLKINNAGILLCWTGNKGYLVTGINLVLRVRFNRLSEFGLDQGRGIVLVGLSVAHTLACQPVEVWGTSKVVIGWPTVQ